MLRFLILIISNYNFLPDNKEEPSDGVFTLSSFVRSTLSPSSFIFLQSNFSTGLAFLLSLLLVRMVCRIMNFFHLQTSKVQCHVFFFESHFPLFDASAFLQLQFWNNLLFTFQIPARTVHTFISKNNAWFYSFFI